MMQRIQLTEQQWSEPLSLEPKDIAFVAERLRGKWQLFRSLASDAVQINPAQYVGVLRLPSGTSVYVQPKVPVNNLFYMLAVALRRPELFDETVLFDSFEDLFELVAAHFADLVTERVDQGLYRSYSEVEEVLTPIKGRIVFFETLQHNRGMQHRHQCRHSVFSGDIAENRIIRYVAHLLSAWGFSGETTRRLRMLDVVMSDIGHQVFSAVDVGRFNYHRFNEDYRPIHELCALFLESTSMSHDSGSYEMRSFVIDMNFLFERFVTQLLADNCPVQLQIVPQSPFYLDSAAQVELRPDIRVDAFGAAMAMADCKYMLAEDERYKNANVYQVLAYCVARNVRTAILVYPKHEQDVTGELWIDNGRLVIRQMSIELAGPAASLIRQSQVFAAKFFEMLAPATRLLGAGDRRIHTLN